MTIQFQNEEKFDMKKIDWSLYLCTDRNLTRNRSLEESVELAIRGGVTVVQVREKDSTDREFFETALKIRSITSRYKIPLIINDRIDIAMAVDAYGVHVGQTDLPCSILKKISKDLIVGVSVSTIEEAIRAESDEADYLGVGAIFSTNTKSDADSVSIATLKKIRESVKIPVIAIGGINSQNLSIVKSANVDGVAVVSAIISSDDPERSARDLINQWKSE